MGAFGTYELKFAFLVLRYILPNAIITSMSIETIQSNAIMNIRTSTKITMSQNANAKDQSKFTIVLFLLFWLFLR